MNIRRPHQFSTFLWNRNKTKKRKVPNEPHNSHTFQRYTYNILLLSVRVLQWKKGRSARRWWHTTTKEVSYYTVRLVNICVLVVCAFILFFENSYLQQISIHSNWWWFGLSGDVCSRMAARLYAVSILISLDKYYVVKVFFSLSFVGYAGIHHSQVFHFKWTSIYYNFFSSVTSTLIVFL